MEHVVGLNRLPVIARNLDCGRPPAALGAPSSRQGQPSRFEGGPDTICVSAGALRASEVNSVTVGAGGEAEQGCSLGRSGEGEGWVADHYELLVVG